MNLPRWNSSLRAAACTALAALALAWPAVVRAQDAAVDSATVASTPDSLAPAADAAPADSAVSAAPTPDPNPRLGTIRKVRLVGGPRNVARSGPGDQYAVVGVYPGKSEFVVLAVSGDWYGVQLSETETGWLHRSLCQEFDDLSNLRFRPNPRAYSRTGTFILAGHTGGYAFDRKSNSFVLGGRLGYYVFDRLQADLGVGWTHVHRPAEIVESLFGLTLEAEDFPMLFYDLNATLELLPGRQMVPYVVVGVGSTILQGESEPSFNYGAGTTLFLSKRTGMRWEVRDYRFDSGSKNSRRSNDNIQFTLGSLWLF